MSELAARAEKAERDLARARATLAEHVNENLALHARCAELEVLLDTARDAAMVAVARGAELEERVAEFGELARQAREALAKLERERDHAESERDELTTRLRAMGAFDSCGGPFRG